MLLKKSFRIQFGMIFAFIIFFHPLGFTSALAETEGLKIFKKQLNTQLELLAVNQDSERGQFESVTTKEQASKPTKQKPPVASEANQGRSANPKSVKQSPQKSQQKPVYQRQQYKQSQDRNLQSAMGKSDDLSDQMSTLASRNSKAVANGSIEIVAAKSGKNIAANEVSDSQEDELQTCPYFMSPSGGHMMMRKGSMAGMPGMETCPMFSDKVELNISEIDSGVIIKWTSSDVELRKKIKLMAEHMKLMHSRAQENKTNGSKK